MVSSTATYIIFFVVITIVVLSVWIAFAVQGEEVSDSRLTEIIDHLNKIFGGAEA